MILTQSILIKDEDDEPLLDLTKSYFIETSLHGLKYLTEAKRKSVERFFWMIAIVISWVFAGYMIYKVK